MTCGALVLPLEEWENCTGAIVEIQWGIGLALEMPNSWGNLRRSPLSAGTFPWASSDFDGVAKMVVLMAGCGKMYKSLMWQSTVWWGVEGGELGVGVGKLGVRSWG